MKIELNHEMEDIIKLIDEGKYSELPEGVTEEDVKATLQRFNQVFQAFEVGTLIAFLSAKYQEEFTTLSRVMEIMLTELGFESFKSFTNDMGEAYDDTLAEYKKSIEGSLEEAEANGDTETDSNV